jgi:hypothetical protein
MKSTFFLDVCEYVDMQRIWHKNTHHIYAKRFMNMQNMS